MRHGFPAGRGATVLVLAALGTLMAACGPRVMAQGDEAVGQRVVRWEGRARMLEYSRRPAVYYTADDFHFQFESSRQGRWHVISREPTPFEKYRMGPTYTGLKVDWSAQPEVRVLAVKGVDRIPPTFPGLALRAERTLTALILEVKVGSEWKPWYVNNWFHKWGTAEENARIAREYVGRREPYRVYGFRSDAPARLTARSEALSRRLGEWRCYAGYLVREGDGPALELTHVFSRDVKTGGYACVYGNPAELVPLSQLSPVQALAAVLSTGVEPPLAATSGWPMAGGDPARQGKGAALTLPLRSRWEAAGAKEFAGGPVIGGGRVFIGNNDRHLYALDAASGRLLWKFPTGGEVESTPALYRDLVIFGSFDGSVYGVEAATGKQRWVYRTGPRMPGIEGLKSVTRGVDSSPAVAGERVYFGAWDGKVHCLEAGTGRTVWTRQLGSLIHWSAPAVAEGRLVIGSTDGKLNCLRVDDGALAWSVPVAKAHLDAMMSGPAIDRGMVFVGGGYENGFYAFSLADGRQRWKFSARNLVCSTPAVDGERVYGFTDGAGQIFALDRETGRTVWVREFGKGWGACNPVLSGKALFVTMREGSDNGQPLSLVALDRGSGATLWKHAGGPAWSGPAVAPGLLVYGSDDGKVRAFTP